MIDDSRIRGMERLALPAGRLLGLILFAALVCSPTTAQAASGGVQNLPVGVPPGQKRPKPSGLSITIGTSWLASNGYRPVQISITPAAPIVADRTLMVRVSPMESPDYHGTRTPYFGVTQQFDLPAQSSGVSGTISVPQFDAWGQLSLEVFEDGELVEDLSGTNIYLNAEGGLNGSSTYNNVTSAVNIGRTPAVLQIGGSENDSAVILNETRFSPWAWLCVDVPDQPGSAATSPGPGFLNPLQLAIQPKLSAAALPQKWIDYSSVDIFYVSLPKLQNFIATQPKEWAAIRKAIAAGANLWVFDVGDRFERIADLERAVDLPRGAERGRGLTAGAIAALEHAVDQPREMSGGSTDGKDELQSPPGWTAPDLKMEYSGAVVEGVQLDSGVRTTRPSITPQKTPPFAIRSLGRGQVIAIGAKDPATPSFNWSWLLNTAGSQRLIWTARHGLLLGGNVRGENAADFWEFLIPGVGLTPVLQFQLLISLFVIGIGPVNYFLLRRWRRLSLLLITVPASAAVVTLVLFGYALVHDGFGVRVRARSFTQLDLRRGEAVCWTRLSYYAGMTPSRGLRFPGDVAVYPLEQEPIDYRGRRQRSVELTWEAAEPNSADGLPSQHLSSDWLPARTPKQFITVRSRKTAARLGITETKPGQQIQLENHLGTRILSIAIADAGGVQFAGGEMADGQSATLVPAASGEALNAVHATLNGNKLELPPDAQDAWFQRSNRYYSSRPPSRYNMSSTAFPPGQPGFEITSSGPMPQSEAMLERSLGEWTKSLAPRRFVAVVERSPEVALGLESVSEEASLHIVAGEW